MKRKSPAYGGAGAETNPRARNPIQSDHGQGFSFLLEVLTSKSERKLLWLFAQVLKCCWHPKTILFPLPLSQPSFSSFIRRHGIYTTSKSPPGKRVRSCSEAVLNLEIFGGCSMGDSLGVPTGFAGCCEGVGWPACFTKNEFSLILTTFSSCLKELHPKIKQDPGWGLGLRSVLFWN
jgi:hypothetical protein